MGPPGADAAAAGFGDVCAGATGESGGVGLEEAEDSRTWWPGRECHC